MTIAQWVETTVNILVQIAEKCIVANVERASGEDISPHGETPGITQAMPLT